MNIYDNERERFNEPVHKIDGREITEKDTIIHKTTGIKYNVKITQQHSILLFTSIKGVILKVRLGKNNIKQYQFAS